MQVVLTWLLPLMLALPVTPEVSPEMKLRLTDFFKLEGTTVMAPGAAGSVLAGYLRLKFQKLAETYQHLDGRLLALEQTLHSIDETLKARAAAEARRAG